ncbi:MAG: hypothetical protein ACM3NT_04075 [Methylocystaceae bacterium]
MLEVIESSSVAAATEEQDDDDYPPNPEATKANPSEITIHAFKSPFRYFWCIICEMGESWLQTRVS